MSYDRVVRYGMVSFPQFLNNANQTIHEAHRNAVKNGFAYHGTNKVVYGKKFLPGEFDVGESVIC